jgi:hypothetical protein
MADFGYDVSDYTGIDPLFDTLPEFDALLSADHANGLKMLLDLVPTSRASRFDATIAPNPNQDQFLHSNGGACPTGGGQSPGVTARVLDTAAPSSANAKFRAAASVTFAGGNAWKEIGTRALTVP